MAELTMLSIFTMSITVTLDDPLVIVSIKMLNKYFLLKYFKTTIE